MRQVIRIIPLLRFKENIPVKLEHTHIEIFHMQLPLIVLLAEKSLPLIQIMLRPIQFLSIEKPDGLYLKK